ncbi:MAG TPA: hypothetical protein VKA41_08945 [Solirubrobacterales bacterium]|nr:hypothetical protein [Solirubrobacterales bacterium]
MKRKRWKPAAGAIALGLVGLTLGACGSGEGETTTQPQPPPISAASANDLASLSDEIATDLDAGETCSAAYSADDLKDAVEATRMSAPLRSAVAEVSDRLVDEVNCPPPPPPPEPEKEEKKNEEKEKKEEEGNENKDQRGDEGGDEEKPKPPGHGGVPPGQAKLKGEDG